MHEVSESVDRQPRRNRRPHYPRMPGNGHRHGCRLFGGGSRMPCTSDWRTRRIASVRQHQGQLSEFHQYHKRRHVDRMRRDPSRLRFFVRKCGFRRNLRKLQHRFHRPVGRSDRPDGGQIGSETDDEGGRMCRSFPVPTGWWRDVGGSGRTRPRDRISAHDQGDGGRRRQRDPHCRK